MKTFSSSSFLRWVLFADAAATGATGLLMALAAPMLSNILGLPLTLLFVAGVILIPYAAFVGYLGTRARLQPAAVWALIVCNVLWGIDCTFVALSGWVAPSTLGYGFILMQIVVVVAFAELQYIGLRKSMQTALPA